jgi:hypothetical protein
VDANVFAAVAKNDIVFGVKVTDGDDIEIVAVPVVPSGVIDRSKNPAVTFAAV